MSGRTRITGALVGLIALVVLGWLFSGGIGDSTDSTGGPGVNDQSAVATTRARPLSELPPQAADIWQLIEADGPFEYDRDGATFGNREGLLPKRADGYYREYTVPTPGENDRGARRFVTGAGGELFYTADHYRSFVPVDPDR